MAFQPNYPQALPRKAAQTVDIGAFYAIIGKDGREYKVEILGKRVTDTDTDVYIHFEGTDKRLDEWVDIQRIMPLMATPTTAPTGSTNVQSEIEMASPAGESSSLEVEGSAGSGTVAGGDTAAAPRQKRKAVKDEVALLTESSSGPPSRKRSGDTGLEEPSATATGAQKANAHHHQEDEEVPRVRNVEWILYAGYDIATWYYSPFPEEYQDCPRLFICEYCLKYIRQVENFMSHTKTCKRKRPPGTVVYSKGVNKIYKVDGKTNKLYCQNLSLLAKLFLDNKTLYFDVHGFQFFVLTETRGGDRADVPVGFFSKEIVSYDGYNLACILTLPPFQRKGYGKLLIEFSYELTKIEGKVGSPEKPLSDLGKVGYVSYWTTAILRELYPKPWPPKRILPIYGSKAHRRQSLQKMKSPSPMPPHTPSTSAPLPETVAKEGTKSAEPIVVSATVSTVKVEPPELEYSSSSVTAMQIDPPVETAESASTKDIAADKELAFSIRELATRTGIMEDDLLETLVTMGWMKRWLPVEESTTASSSLNSVATPGTVPLSSLSEAISTSKRNFRKLMRFDEQQQLYEKYGRNGHDTGADDHDHHSVGHRSPPHASNSGVSGAAAGHSMDHSQPHHHHHKQQRNRDGTFGSSASNGLATPVRYPHSFGSSTIGSVPLEAGNVFSMEFDPVECLDSVEEVEDNSSPGAVEESGRHAHHHAHGHAHAHPSHHHHLLDQVAVVTLQMVKEYQDVHNIRLEPYLDWKAIDWKAYHSTLESLAPTPSLAVHGSHS